MGSKTNTATTAQTSTPINQAALQSIYGQVAGAASNPYTPYTGELTAGVNGQQNAGIGTINSAAGAAQPYYNQAGSLIQGASSPLTSAQIQNYENPYTQSVVNATQNQFNDQNAQAQSSLKGSAAAQGAGGGDRQAVAQAILSGQQQTAQAPVIAGLQAQGYNTAVQTAAQQYQQNPLAAASAYGGLGTAAEQAALAGGQAQLGAGTLQQQTQQAADTANYGQYQAAQGFPYQQAAFLEQYGLPAALAQGTTSNGTQTTQGPTSLATILGLGTTAVGALGNQNVQNGLGAIGSGIGSIFGAKDGGAINGYATGGTPFSAAPSYVTSDVGYLPKSQAAQSTFQAPTLSYLKPSSQSSTTNPFSSALNALGGSGTSNSGGNPVYGGGNIFTDAYGGSSSHPLDGLTAADYGEGFSSGGFVRAVHDIHRSIKRSRGHYDDGGDVSFADRFQPAVDAPLSPFTPQGPVVNPDTPFRMPDQAAVDDWRKNADQPNPALVADVPSSPLTPAALPKEIVNPDDTPPPSPLTTAFAPGNGNGPIGANGNPTDILPVGASTTSAQPQSSFPHFSDKMSNAIMATGLGMLASRSPFVGNAIGEGGLMGLKSLNEADTAEQAAADKAATRGQEQQRIDLQAKQLAATLDQHRLAAAAAPITADGKINPTYIALKKQEADINQKDNWAPVGSVISSDGSSHPLVMNKADHTAIDLVTQKPPLPTDRIQGVPGKGPDPAVIQHNVDAIVSGHQPPTLTGLYGQSAAVKAGLEEKGFDLAKAQLEWKQAEKQVSSLNAPQMVRFVGLAHGVDNTIDEVRDLSKQMKLGGIPALNSVELAAYIKANGNSENGQLATRYLTAVNTLKEEFANLANGGFAPTEAVWKLANDQINGNYGVKQMGASLDEVQRLIRYRVNAMPGLSQSGPGSANRYTNQPAAGQPPAANAPPAGQPPAATAPPAAAPPAIPAPADRVPGQVYQTPRGPAKWTGQGWVMQ